MEATIKNNQRRALDRRHHVRQYKYLVRETVAWKLSNRHERECRLMESIKRIIPQHTFKLSINRWALFEEGFHPQVWSCRNPSCLQRHWILFRVCFSNLEVVYHDNARQQATHQVCSKDATSAGLGARSKLRGYQMKTRPESTYFPCCLVNACCTICIRLRISGRSRQHLRAEKPWELQVGEY